jgi:type I restriction enzyme S subunit
MNPDLLLAHFERIGNAPDAIPRLRRFILDLAVRGKVVDQDRNDESAADLLRRIRADKTRFPNGAALKQVGRPTSSTSDEPQCVFPRGWIVTTLGQVAHKITDGAHKTPTYVSEGIPFISVKDFSGGRLDFSHTRYISPEEHARLYKRCDARRGDILIARIGTLGKAVLVDTDIEFSLFVSVGLIRFNQEFIDSHFLRLFLNSPLAEAEYDRIKVGGGTHTNKLNLGDLHSVLLPLPPLAEQHRIVAKVDELMALCDRLESEQGERERRRDQLAASSLHHINNSENAEVLCKHTHFYLSHLPRLTIRPDQIPAIRQTILNLAVRGQLVRQDSNDEPAALLLKQIQTEKRRPESALKRKRERQLPALDLSQAPFKLPAGWTWARFEELGTFGRGKSKHRPRNDPSLFDGGTHLMIQTGDVARSNGLIKTYTNKYNELGLAQSMKWPKGTLCITIAANIADSGILSVDACFPDSIVGFIPACAFPEARYFEYFIRTAKANLREFAPSTAQKNINLEILDAVLIPLPPLAEQERIVSRVDELMAVCDKLQAQLTLTQTENSRLLESVLHHAINDAKPTTLHGTEPDALVMTAKIN